MAGNRQHIIHGLRDGIPIAMGYFAVTFSLGITFLIIILFLFFFYNVVINCEDGEYYEYEVEADTFAKATEIAEGMAMDLMADITFIEVYKA